MSVEAQLNELSTYFDVAPTKYGGRGCYSSKPIARGTVVLKCGSPVSSTIIRPFRKEVCQQCFAYHNGSNLKHKESKKIEGSVYSLFFCSEKCRIEFHANDVDGVLCEWLLQIEKHYLVGLKKLDPEYSDPPCAELPDLIVKEWAAVDIWEEKMKHTKKTKWQVPRIDESQYMDAKYIVGVLFGIYKSKCEPLPKEVCVREEILTDSSSVTSVLFSRSNSQSSCSSANSDFAKAPPTPNELDIFSLLQSSELEKTKRYPYLLYAYIDMYKFIKVTAPDCIRDLINPDLVRTILGRSISNAFGIWSDSPQDDAKEYFGFAVFPSASFFNHSCDPNLKKERVGHGLVFRTTKDVLPGDELCIDYGNFLSDPVEKRRQELKEWFFDCLCQKCQIELQ